MFLASNASFFLLNGSTYGFLFCVFLSALFLSNRTGFWETLEHELEHAVLACLLLRRPLRLTVDPDPKVDSKMVPAGRPNVLITLAPYYFPLLTIPLLIARLLAGALCPSILDALDFLIGFAFASHYVSLVREFRPYQTDLKTAGYLFSTIFTIVINVVLPVIIAGVVANNFHAIGDYFARSLVRSLESYDFLLQVWRGPK